MCDLCVVAKPKHYSIKAPTSPHLCVDAACMIELKTLFVQPFFELVLLVHFRIESSDTCVEELMCLSIAEILS